jgi:site-specific DNA recombinase
MKEQIIYPNKQAAAIIRVSDSNQKDGYSLSVQLAEIEGYCEQNGLNLVKTFKIVESAKDSKDRKQYQQAMSFILKNKIGNVLFYLFDREARNLTDLETNEEYVQKGLFIIHYVKDRQIFHSGSSDSEILTRNIFGTMAKQYSRVLSTRVNDGMTKKAESGWCPISVPPLGYVNDKIDPETGKIKKRGGIIVPDPNEHIRRVVLREFELRADGLSYENIRKQIISEGLINHKRFGTYPGSALHTRLNNRFYWGQFYWKGKLYEGKHELIIPTHILEKVFALSGQRILLTRERTQYTILMGGWLKCSCGCHILYDPKKKVNRKTLTTREYHYYRCSNGKRAHESQKNMNITNDQIWLQLGNAVEDIHISNEFAQEIAKALNDIEKKSHSTAHKQVDALLEQQKILRAREDRIIDMYHDGLLNPDSFKRQQERIRAEQDDLLKQLRVLQKSLTSTVVETCKSVIELANNAKSLWITQSPYERKKVLDVLLSNPVLDGSTIRYDLKKPFALLKEMSGDEKWRTRVVDFATACLSAS